VCVPLLFLSEKPGQRRCTLAFRIARRLNGRSSCERLILFSCTSAGIVAKIPHQSQHELQLSIAGNPWADRAEIASQASFCDGHQRGNVRYPSIRK
jgi:hypothetical protein